MRGPGGASVSPALGAGDRVRNGAGDGSEAGFGSVMTAAMAAASPASSKAKQPEKGLPGEAGAGTPRPLQKPGDSSAGLAAPLLAQGAGAKPAMKPEVRPEVKPAMKPEVKPEAKPGGEMAAGTEAGRGTRTKTGTETGKDLAYGATGAGSSARAAFAQVVEAVKGLPVETAEPVGRRGKGAGASGGVENTGGGTKAVAGAKVRGVEGLDVAMQHGAKAGAAIETLLETRAAHEKMVPTDAGKANAVSKAVDPGAGVTGSATGNVTGDGRAPKGSTESGGTGRAADGAAQGRSGRSAKGESKKEPPKPGGTALPGTFLQAAVLPVPGGAQAAGEGAKAGAVKADSVTGKTGAGAKVGRSSVPSTGVARERGRAWAAVVEAARGNTLPGTVSADGEKSKANVAAGVTALAKRLMGKDTVSGAGEKILAKQGPAAANAAVPGVAPGAVSGSVSGSVSGDGQNTGLATGEPAGQVTGSVPGPVSGLAAGPAEAPKGSGLAVVPGAGHAGGRGSASQAKNVTGKGAIAAGTAATGGNGSMAGGGFTATLLNGHPGTAMPHSVVQHASGAAGGVGTANPYMRMDEPQRPALVYASPQKMAVAVSDPALGSFQVRAQGAGAQVAASLATSSAATHAQLSGHLPSLTAFLQDQRVDVSRVTVVQQNLLGGDAGPRDFGGRQQQGRPGSRRARSGRVGSAESAGPVATGTSVSPAGSASGSKGGSGVAGIGPGAGAAAEAADSGGMLSVDVHA